MSDDDGPQVPIHCPECETTTRVPFSELADRIEAHNESVHDGDDVAQVDPGVAEQFQDIVLEESGLLEDDA
ncbi:hypothetical protein [Halolamina sediminis]|jgi:hypothetical protein|uniref:hypothetical protein n=1 Tax=Halolamina sediminis TaxID=1480675 RepID=UPI0006B4AA60|nr:hypothetical protein [Halolamina sediminis]